MDFLHYSGAQGEKQARRNGFGALKEIFYTLFNLRPQVEDAAERAVRAQMARARDGRFFGLEFVNFPENRTALPLTFSPFSSKV
ncbi:MAG: hypothetical protein U0M22_02080 [Acutalibacteraceae bacterium]|nr:hypothetical protein [Acutalibacteraceae bacterium]